MDFSKQDGTSSIKLHHAPGGKSNFSLAWDTEPQKNVAPNKKQVPTHQAPINQPKQEEYQKASNVATSVKVHAPPGGKSNFTLG